MKIYITRHSLTTWNEEKRLQGWKNSDLTKQGLEDAKRLGNYLKNQSFDGIYSSPLKRAKETAQLIFPNKTIIEDDRLKEMNFGDYEGKFIDELKKEKDYYTPDEVDRLTDEEMNDPKIRAKVRKSMTKWK